MSTMTAFAKGRRALIATDTAGLDGDGVVRSWVSKIITVPHLRMAVTTRGAIAALPALTNDLVAEFPSFDEMVEHGAEFLADIHDHHMMRLADFSGCGEFELAVVGWSPSRGRCEAHAISSMDNPGLPAFTFMRNDILAAPPLSTDDLKAAGLMVNGIVPDSNPETLLLSLIEIQRRQRIPLGGIDCMPKHFIVGGQVVLTEITEAGISQRIARTWPDRIGEHVHPEPAAIVDRAPTRSNMSRQQRRALEAQSRKAVRNAVT